MQLNRWLHGKQTQRTPTLYLFNARRNVFEWHFFHINVIFCFLPRELMTERDLEDCELFIRKTWLAFAGRADTFKIFSVYRSFRGTSFLVRAGWCCSKLVPSSGGRIHIVLWKGLPSRWLLRLGVHFVCQIQGYLTVVADWLSAKETVRWPKVYGIAFSQFNDEWRWLLNKNRKKEEI